MGIPYQSIGIGIGFLLGIWVFIMAETPKGRTFILITLLLLFLLPVLWRHPASGLISFIGWIVFGMGCFIFIEYWYTEPSSLGRRKASVFSAENERECRRVWGRCIRLRRAQNKKIVYSYFNGTTGLREATLRVW
jgi:hypothetical protein